MYFDFLVCIILLFIIYTNFTLIGSFALNTFKINLNFIYSFFIGNAIFVVLLTILFNIFALEIISIIILFSIIFLALLYKFFLSHINLLIKLYKNFLIFYLPVILFFIFIALIYKENFYVFRGNQWDLFAQISYGLIFSENNLIDFNKLAVNEINNSKIIDTNIIGGGIHTKSYYFYFVEKFTHRQLQGLYLALLYSFKSIDIFVLTYALKVFFISSIPASFYLLINEIGEIDSFIKKYILSIAFTLSTWSIYIFEIDALAQLSTYPLTIIFLSIGFHFFKNIKNSSFNIYILAILSGALFLSYPEQAVVMIGSMFFFILIYKRNIFKEKKTYLALIIFLFITSPKLYGYANASFYMSLAKNDFWGYFGSFILGSKNLVSSDEGVSLIKLIISNDQISSISKILDIIKLHFQNGYTYILLTIIPSIAGYYFLVDGKNLSLINLFFLIIFNFYLIILISKNIKNIFFENNLFNKYIKFFLIFAFTSIIFFLIQFKIYICLKLLFYLSPIFFILIILNFKNKNKINYILVIPLLFFPIFKYSEYNSGIGKIDSFPSILNKELKRNINWSFPIDNVKNCQNVHLTIDEQIPNIYASFYLDYYDISYFNDSVFVSNTIENSKIYECELFLNNGNFIIK